MKQEIHLKNNCPQVWTIQCYNDDYSTGYDEWYVHIPFYKKFFLSYERKKDFGNDIVTEKYLVVQDNQILLVVVEKQQPNSNNKSWYPTRYQDIEIKEVEMSEFDISTFREVEN